MMHDVAAMARGVLVLVVSSVVRKAGKPGTRSWSES
jgi:hypothetical protein